MNMKQITKIYTIIGKRVRPTPMKVMSWDIEASSSRGDFPVAKKSYRKMIGEIIQYWTKNKKEISKKSLDDKNKLFIKLALAAFEYGKVTGISRVYLSKSSIFRKNER